MSIRKKLIVQIIIIVLVALAIKCTGCTKLIIPVGDKEIVYEKGWIEATADNVVLKYKGEGIEVWIIVSGPKSSVNPGRLSVVEPRTGIKGELVTE